MEWTTTVCTILGGYVLLSQRSLLGRCHEHHVHRGLGLSSCPAYDILYVRTNTSDLIAVGRTSP